MWWTLFKYEPLHCDGPISYEQVCFAGAGMIILFVIYASLAQVR